jgi:hypothetical protein
VGAADQERLVSKGIRNFNPDFGATGAGMHDKPQSLVPKGLDIPR